VSPFHRRIFSRTLKLWMTAAWRALSRTVLRAMSRNGTRGPAGVAVRALLCATLGMSMFSCAKREVTLAITHVTVIDGTGAPAQPDMTVLIASGRIAAISASAAADLPWRTTIVDGHGKYLIPGLADMHVHLTGAGEPDGSRKFIIPLLIANGITSVRDMGGYLDSLLPLRREIEEGKRLGPRIIFAGPYLDGNPPAFQPSLVVTNEVQASDDVRDLMRRGVDFIKVQSHLSRDVYFAVAAACNSQHVSFVGHVPDRVTAAEASAAGQKSIEHLTGVLRACSKDEPKLMREQFLAAAGKEKSVSSPVRQLDWESELLRSFSETQAHSLIQEFVANGTWQTPTLILLQQDSYAAEDVAGTRDPRTKYVPRAVFDRWRQSAQREAAGASTGGSTGASAREYALRKELMEKSKHVVGEMQKAGAKILAGTDTAAPFVYPGFSLHEELALLVQSGLTPMEALQAATSRAAEFMGKSATQGTIERGKVADLVLLDADPLADIHSTSRIRAVVVRGKLLDRAALDTLLSSVEQFAASR
jgi:imidazolonepropionase-like amidohydrolase